LLARSFWCHADLFAFRVVPGAGQAIGLVELLETRPCPKWRDARGVGVALSARGHGASLCDLRAGVPTRTASIREGRLMMIVAENVEVQFFFDRHLRVVTPNCRARE
jgi:hypothetical protein